MSNEKGTYNVRKQVSSQGDIYNIVIYREETKEKLTLPSIQWVLRKGGTFKGDFFKKGPEWVDFKQGFIVERREVNEIIKRLENTKIQLIIGAPASGKSVILKNVGFKLANNNIEVYVIELKQYSKSEIKLYFDTIPGISDEKAIFIVDDAHLHPSDCESLIKDFESRGKGRLIVGSRKTNRITEGNLKESSVYDYLRETCIHVKTESVTEKIIKCFLKREHREYNFSDERISAITANLEEYKNDLWVLSWALNVYNPEKDLIKKEDIYKNIKDTIREIKVGKETKLNAEDVFFPLSIFYRFEIPIERAFLEEQLGIEKNMVNQLIGQSEIIETEEIGQNRMLSLNHSSIAELYYETYLMYPSLGERIKKKVDQKDFTTSLFRHYLIYKPTNYGEVIIYLDKNIILDIFKDNDVCNAVQYLLMSESDIGKIIILIRELLLTNVGIAKDLVESLDVDKLKSKLESEHGLMWIANFVGDISIASSEVANALVDIVKLKIEKESDVEKIGISVRNISVDSSEVGKGLVEGNIVYHGSSDGSFEIFKHEKQPDTENGYLISNIRFKSGEVGGKLVGSLNMKNLKTKIEKERDIEKIGSCISDIAFANSKVGKNLVKSVKKDLKTKIEREQDIEKIGRFVSAIISANHRIGVALFSIVKPKIEIERDIEKIGSCLKYISYGNKGIGGRLVKSLNMDELKTKIEREQDVKKIRSCIDDISYVSGGIGNALVESLNMNELKTKIEREQDIEKIGSFIFYTSWKRSNIGMVLVKSLNMNELKTKIEREQDIEKIGRLYKYISWADSNIGNMLVESLNMDELKTKIEKEQDIKKIERCIDDISKVDEDIGNMLFESLNLNLKLGLNLYKASAGDEILPMIYTSSEMSKFLRDMLKIYS